MMLGAAAQRYKASTSDQAPSRPAIPTQREPPDYASTSKVRPA
jgi:hypothetical protein